MRQFTLLLSILFAFLTTFSQNIVFQEDFEGGSLNLTSSSTGSTDWGLSDTYSKSGNYSDSATVSAGDTIYLTSNSFSTTGNANVMFQFSHIAKIEFGDQATIEVSIDGGNSWTQLTGGQYLGSGYFGGQGNAFGASSYPEWMPGVNSALPTNSWWRTELFDISSIASDKANVQIRFALTDGISNNGPNGNIGWFLDDVKVTAAIDELIPPSITLLPPYKVDTIFTNQASEITSAISDVSGVDTAYLVYFINGSLEDTLPMTEVLTDTFSASIPFHGYGRTIEYTIYAVDGSAVSNLAFTTPFTYVNGYDSQPTNNDIGVAELVYPTGGVTTSAPFDIKVRVKNFGLDTITDFEVAWEFNGVSQTNYIYSGDTLFPNDLSDTITLGSKTVGVGTQSLKVWTENPNNNSDFNTLNDSIEFDFYGCSSLLNGTYTIGGASADYASFSDAALALNQCGISGPVVFNVADGVYNEQFILENFSGSSATNTVTFQSASADSSLVIIQFDANSSADNYVVELNETKNIIFQNISFESLNGTYGKVFKLRGEVANLKLMNNHFRTDSAAVDATDLMALIYAHDNMGDEVVIQNNYFENGSQAIRLVGSSLFSNNWNISNNTIKGHYGIGINVTNTNSVLIKYNEIVADTNSTYDFYRGIVVESSEGTAEISYNSIKTNNTEIAYGIRIINSIFSATNPSIVYNNILNLYSSSTSSTISCGIQNRESKNVDYVFNTIHFEGAHDLAANVLLYDDVATTENINILNNNFSNNAEGSIYYATSNIALTTINADYNNYYFGPNGMLVNAGTDFSDLSAWQNATSLDMNSVSQNPNYSSLNDLTINNNLINNIGTPISGITDDYLGVTRDVNNPDVGAIEFDASPYDIQLLSITAPTDGCGYGSEDVTISLKNIGSSAISGNLTANYILGDTVGTLVSESISATINSGATFDFTFSTKANLDVSSYGKDSTYNFLAWVDLTNDSDNTNDTLRTDIKSGFVPTAPITSDTSTDYGTSITLTAQASDSLVWYESQSSTVELAKTNNYTTNPLYDTTTFYVATENGSGKLAITEVTQYQGSGSGATNPEPAWLDGDDFVEISNVGSAALDLTGYTYHREGSSSNYDINYNLPPLTLNPGEVIVLATYGANADDTTNSFFVAGSYSVSSSTSTGHYITDNSGKVIDAVALNGYSFSNSVITSADWNGSIASSSGNAGVVRTILDNNNASDWQISSLIPQSLGAFNSQLQIGFSGGACQSPRIPLTVNVINFPQIDAGINGFTSIDTSLVDGDVEDVKVILMNQGQNALTSVDIIYGYLNQPKDTFNWTGNLAYNQIDTVHLTTITADAGVYNLIAYSDMPNGVSDNINSNDTSYFSYKACFSGQYSIGASSTNDFNDFSTVTQYLNEVGVCGDVTFNIETGTYNEQILLTEITGASANSTITFTSQTGDSTDVVVEYSPATNAEGVLHINGADHITFKNMTFKASSGASNGRVVIIEGGSDYVSILNNVIETEVSTSSSFAGIYSSGSVDNYTQIMNNYIKNGYYGIYWRGDGSSTRKLNSVIENNIIEGFYYYGVYLYYLDSVQFISNKITARSNANYAYGIYNNYTFDGSKIMNNEISINTPTSTGTKYGIRSYYVNRPSFVGLNNEEVIVANNIVNITSSGTKYGLYNYYNDNIKFYYNTVKLSGSGSTVEALRQNNSSTYHNIGEEYLNNIFIDDVGDYAAVYDYPASINVCDYNNYFTTSTGVLVEYDNNDMATLTDLQNASGKDANSVSIDPEFISNSNLRMFSTLLSGKGVYTADVPTDIDGTQRPLTGGTTIGAHELPMIPNDIGVIAFVNAPDSIAEGQSTSLDVVVRNFGSDDIYGYQVEIKVNGGTAISTSFPTDSLLIGQIDTISLNSFISPAGLSNICASTVLAGDSNAFNDMTCHNFFGIPQYDAYLTEINEYTDFCGLGVENIGLWIENIGVDTLDGIAASATATYVFDDGITKDTITEALSINILPGQSDLFYFTTTVDMTNGNPYDSTFEITAWIDYPGDNFGFNDTAFYALQSLGNPPAPIVSQTFTANYGQTATITASSPDTLRWYLTDSSVTETYIGEFFTTPQLFDTTDFWVEARQGVGELKFTEVTQYQGFGSGATSPEPAWLIGDDFVELTNVGTAQIDLTGFVYNREGSSSSYDLTYNLPSIVLGSGEVLVIATYGASADDPANNFYNASGTSVSSSAATGHWLVNSNGDVVDAVALNGHTFSTTDVTSADWSGSIASSSGDAGVVRIVSDNNNASDWDISDNVQQTLGTVNPQLNITIGSGGNTLLCPSPRVPVTVNVVGFTPLDAGISAIINPSSSIVSGSTHPVTVEIYNYGINDLTSADINWTINGVSQTPHSWTGNLAYSQSETVTLDTITFSGGVYDIMAWTTNPNNQNDTINGNDTSYVNFNACMQGLYTIGDTTGAANFDFPNFTSALNAVTNAGICGDVTFEVASGTYNEQLIVDEVPGASINSTITFTSQTGDSTDVIVEYTLPSNSEGVLYFIGGDYFTFSNMTFKSSSSSSYGRIVYIEGGSDNNKILNNYIESGTGTSSSFAGIYSYGTIDNYNIIKNNHIKNGYYGICWRGSGNSSRKKNTVIEDNIIEDVNYYGIYTYYNDSIQILGNKITSLQACGTFYGMHINYSFNKYSISNNEIIVDDINDSGTKYGMRTYYGNYYNYMDPTDGPGLISNNMISIVSDGTKYGIYSYYNNDIKYYNNTVVLEGAGSTSRALHQYSTSSNNLGEYYLNNNFIDRVGNYAAYFGTTGNVISSDYNNYYSASGDIAYWSGAKATLSDLKNASNDNLNSVSINPQFISSTNLRLITPQLTGLGTPLAEVPNDIDGNSRPTTATTIGAFEFELLPYDIGISAIYNVGSITNESYLIPITADVTNYGSDTVVGFQVDYVVNNGSTLTDLFPTDTIYPNSFKNVTLTPFASPAGNSNICVTTVLTADSNTFNDQVCQSFFGTPLKDAYLTKMEDIEEGCGLGLDTVQVWIKNIGVDTINGSGQSPFTLSFVNDFGASSNVVTETLTNQVPPNDSLLYTFNTLVDLSNNTQLDSVFKVAVWVDYPGDNVSYNDTLYQDVKSKHTPNDPTFVSPVSVPFGTFITLTANAKPTDSILWFKSDTSLQEFHIGTNYTTGFMYSDDTLWVEANSGSAAPIITEVCHYKTNAGSPTTGWPSYLVADDYIEITGAPGFDLEGYTLEQWDDNSMMSTHTFPAGTILGPNGTAIIAVGQLGSSVPSPSNYYYHGNGNYTSSFSSGGENGRILKNPDGEIVDAVGYGTYSFPAISGVTIDDWSGNTPDGSSSSGNRLVGPYTKDATNWINSAAAPQDPNQLNSGLVLPGGAVGGCSSNRLPMAINVTGQQDNDVSAYKILYPTESVIFPTEEVKVRVMNFGLQAQSNIPVSYTLNGGAPITETINATIPSGDSLDYTFNQLVNLGTVGQTYKLKVYTHLSTDTNYLNDTVSISKPIKWLDIVVNIPYSDNFDSTETYFAKDTVSNQWERGVPTATTLNTAHSAPNVWGTILDATYNSAASDGDKLYTPKFVVDSYDSVSVSFWHIIDVDATNDGGYIQYSTDGVNWPLLGYLNDSINGTNWYNKSSGGDHYWNSTNGWEEASYMIDLISSTSQFVGIDTIQFRFVFESNGTTSKDGWLIDDFSIDLPKVDFDGAVDSITSPKSSPIGSAVTVTASLRNAGLQPISGFPVKLKVNGNLIATETYSGTIQPNDTASYTFITTFSAPANQYNLCVEIDVPNDPYQNNDEVCETVNVTAALYDAMIASIAYPDDTTSLSFNPHVYVWIKNAGVNTLTEIPVEYYRSTGTGFNEVDTFFGNLPSGDSTLFQFTQTYNSPLGNYQICARTNLSNDANPTNDETCKYLFGKPSGIGELTNSDFVLHQNEPNPASDNFKINYELPRDGQIRFELRNNLGQLIKVIEGNRSAGNHSIELDAKSMAAGVYYYNLKFGEASKTLKMVVTK